MKKNITLLLALILFVSGCSGGIKENPKNWIHVGKKSSPPSDFIPKKVQITSVGDSLTEGVGDSTKKGGYIPYLKKDLQSLKGVSSAAFSNYGVMGNRTDQLLQRLKTQKELKDSIKHSDAVIITIGGNDIMQVFRDNLSDLKVDEFQKAIFGYEHRLQSIIKTIRQYNPHASIVLMGIYNPFGSWFSNVQELDEIVANWNNVSNQVVSNYKNAEFVPVYDIFDHKKKLLYTDNFHPDDEGYKLIAERLFTYLKNKKINLLTQK